MADDGSWLADIVVVNESQTMALAGDVSVFRSEAEACSYLEHWWVENGEGFAFTATGQRITLGVDQRQKVVVAQREPWPDGTEVVRSWLQAYANSVLAARRHKAAKGKALLGGFEQRGELPTSIECLIAYVGFDQ